MSRDQFRAILIGSAEYFQKKGNGQDDNWVRAAFLDTLGRPASTEDVVGYLALFGLGVSRTTIAQGLLTSPEGRIHLVDTLYQTYLDRPLDPGGLGWASLLNSGFTEEQLIIELLITKEYFADVVHPFP
jgi:hypothetical protein